MPLGRDKSHYCLFKGRGDLGGLSPQSYFALEVEAKPKCDWLQCCRHANHSAFGGIIPHFRRFSAIPRGICEIPLFHSIHLSHKNLVFSYINL